MGVGYSQNNFQQPNLIMDFEFSLFKPNATARVSISRGPQSNTMPSDIADEIYFAIQHCITDGDKYNASLYTKYYWSLCCCCCIAMPFWVLLPIAIVYGILLFHALDYIQEYGVLSYLAIAGFIVILFLGCYCYCCSAKGVNKAALEWRNNIIQLINQRTQQWQTQWPQFTMTIIYPLITTGRKGRTVNIRGIVRVTQGTPQVVDNMPLYSQYIQQPVYAQNAQAASELVVLNQPLQRAVLIQDQNGQRMMVQGKKAIVNGREVLLVERPANIQPQNAQMRPMQPQMALSTDANSMYSGHGGVPPASAPLVSASPAPPPAYNPAMQQRSAGMSQVEGKGVTVV
eukprot:63836_1